MDEPTTPKPRMHPLAVAALVLVTLVFAGVVYFVVVLRQVTDDVSHELGREAGSAIERGTVETVQALGNAK